MLLLLFVLARLLYLRLSFINFNLPQFYQIVNVDGRAQVIPFRMQAITPWRLLTRTPPLLLSSISPRLFARVVNAYPAYG
ncbi:class I adenylate cyclase [Shigella flexneri]